MSRDFVKLGAVLALRQTSTSSGRYECPARLSVRFFPFSEMTDFRNTLVISPLHGNVAEGLVLICC